jgi:hypothetical protein
VCTEFPKDKEFRAFEMLKKIEFSLKPRRCVGGGGSAPCWRIADREYIGSLRELAATKSASRSLRLADLYLNVKCYMLCY